MPSKLDELTVSALSKPILIINRQTAIVRCNAAAVRLFDYPEDHLLSLTLAQLLAESKQRIQALLQQWEQNDQSVNEETTNEEVLIRRPHGVTFPLAIRGRVLKLGRKRYYMLELRDLSADHRLQQAMLSAQNQADDAAVAKAQFMALISHEIRNPINTMLSTSNAATALWATASGSGKLVSTLAIPNETCSNTPAPSAALCGALCR